ncbi:MAG: tRNA uridine-5-carboxymethylaminomethyl(34) synthesis GTPase MnmE [Clostridia bacterium]|nr:tRNA uridine-5-carboxymethylaminomethyl(34) synthesis GTPase MnmE [Clostridia bacterium]
MDFSSVAAISTPYGRGAIAVIRISGEDALDILDRVFLPASGKKITDYAPGRLIRGDIVSAGRQIDDGMAVFFKAPHSYTGENSAEIYCHGGILVSEEVLKAIFAAGASPAGPGEFTKRAFINGKLGLTEAEAIINTIDAETKDKLDLARSHRKGVLSTKIKGIYSSLLTLVSSAYVFADYPDEDLADISPEEMAERLEGIHTDITDLASTYKMGQAINEGIYTVLAGRPNTGKSSLLNLLLGSDRAIVSDTAGTTRDSIEESVSLGRIILRLCDTAGIREGKDEIEKLGIERSISALERAGLVIAVFDGSQEATDEDRRVCEIVSRLSCAKIALINKSDLEKKFELDTSGFDKTISMSAKYAESSEILTKEIESLFIEGEIDYDSDAIVSSARQRASLDRAAESLTNAINALSSGYTPDVAGLDIEEAMSALGEIDGRTVSEDIVKDIFGRFCVGK